MGRDQTGRIRFGLHRYQIRKGKERKRERRGIQGEEKSVVRGLWENFGDIYIKPRTAGKSLELGCPRTTSQLSRDS